MKEEFFGLILFGLMCGFILGVVSFVCGVMEIDSARTLGVERSKQCVYKSYASQYNYAYRMGCELFKER